MDDQVTFDSLLFPGRKVLRCQEIADALRCDVRHVYDLVDEGKIRAVNISGGDNLTDRRCLRIPVEAWETYLRENTL
jgi:excisionase family DNA binding protein